MSLDARPAFWHGARPGQMLLVSAAGAVTVAAAVLLAMRGMTQLRGAVVFGVLIAAGELVRLRLPRDREFAPIATAAAMAYAMLLSVGPISAVHDVSQVIVVTAAAVVLGAAPHVVAGRRIHIDDTARRILLTGVAALVVRPFAEGLSPVAARSWMALGVLVAAVLAAGAFDSAMTAVARAGFFGPRLRTALRDELRVRAPLGTAVGATALLVSLGAQVMGWWAVPVCMAPLVVTQIAYRRYAGTRATYLQTIRALSRVPEVGGYVEAGHSRRVSQLALRLGYELALSESELRDLEYAALMHDIGQLSLRHPNPGGATVHASPTEQRRIAELGAEVIRQTDVLDRVADIVERQADPYGGGEVPADGDPAAADPPLASRIIRIANAYDDLTGGHMEAQRGRAALQRLRLCGAAASADLVGSTGSASSMGSADSADSAGSAGGYDPRVVDALTRLLDHGRR